MKKIIYMFVFIVLVTGCSNNNIDISYVEDNVINYNLNISDVFKENIYFGMSKDYYNDLKKQIKSNKIMDAFSLGYLLATDKLYPLYYNGDSYYQKTIVNNNNNVGVRLKYNYTEDDFLYHNYIMSCFENYEINSDDSSFSIDLSGKFKCYDNNDINNINIIVNTSYDIIDTNGEKSNKGYKWNINRDNYQNIDIYLKLSRSYDNMIKDNIKHENNNIFFGILKIIFLIFVLFLIFKIYKVYKKRTEV